jgi:hypothetical protein
VRAVTLRACETEEVSALPEAFPIKPSDNSAS